MSIFHLHVHSPSFERTRSVDWNRSRIPTAKASKIEFRSLKTKSLTRFAVSDPIRVMPNEVFLHLVLSKPRPLPIKRARDYSKVSVHEVTNRPYRSLSPLLLYVVIQYFFVCLWSSTEPVREPRCNKITFTTFLSFFSGFFFAYCLNWSLFFLLCLCMQKVYQ